MSTKISLKVAKLKSQNFNLGNKLTNEIEAEYGGFYQRFDNATIYWHPIMTDEAHVINGGILTKYLGLGGFGIAPSGKRLLGFPMSDETRTKGKHYAVNYFEWGAIYWKNGGVALYGKIYEHWKNMKNGSESSWLGYPLADPIKVGGGEAVFFEFGCLWYGTKSNNEVVEIEWNIPQLGNPWMIKPSEFDSKYITRFQFDSGMISKEDAGKLLQDLFDNRIFIKETGKDVQHQVNVNIALLDKKEKPNNIGRYAASFSTLNGASLKNRQLYDICIKLPNNEMYVLSPHCIYVRNSWTDFKFIHAADIHVSMRLDGWRKILKEKGFDKKGEGARVFNNWNDNFREFIQYANSLHNRGELDFILITGDLVDYIFEDGGNYYQNNNFVFFRKLVLGTAPATDQVEAEELLVPIFTSLGNHDYRTNAYYLQGQINMVDAVEDSIPGPVDDLVIDVAVVALTRLTLLISLFGGPSNTNADLPPRNGAFNLTKDEAMAIHGNRIVPQKRAALMVQPDEYNKQGSLDYYFKYINRETTYVINLDAHQILMIDGKWDLDPIDTLGEAIKNYAGFSSEDQKYFADGSPNSIGFFETELQTFRDCLNKKEGLLIVGVHNPIINPKSGEYPYFLRESIRTKEPELEELVRKYLFRRDFTGYAMQMTSMGTPTFVVDLRKKIHSDWSQTNTSYFASGSDVQDMLDYAIMREKKPEFLELCTGVGVSSPADLILSGHVHDNLECRIKWDPLKKKFLFYTDFYTENPQFYYNAADIDVKTDNKTFLYAGDFEKKKTVFRQLITNNAGDNDPMTKDENGFLIIHKKKYPNSLNKIESNEAVKKWWENNRPLFIQTEAIGPMKSQRDDGPLQPIFNGCRHITVIDNLMHKIRYDRKENITNRLSGVEPFYIVEEKKWLEPVLHMMMR